MQNLAEVKDNYSYLLLKNIHIGSTYYSIIKDCVPDISYKFLDNNRIVLVDEGQTAILQLENFLTLFVIKVLYVNEGVNVNEIIKSVTSYVINTIKLIGIESDLANKINFKIYVYHYDPLISLQYLRVTNKDIFENNIGFECNEYFTNLVFDKNYNQISPNFSLFQNNFFGQPNTVAQPSPFSPNSNSAHTVNYIKSPFNF